MMNKRWITSPVVYSRPFCLKSGFLSDFEWIWVRRWLFFIIERQGWKPCFERVPAPGRFFPQNRIAPLSNFAAWRSKDSRFFSYLPIENPSKLPGASPRRKSKSHSIRAIRMHSEILMCQPQTVTLISPFWLDDGLTSSNQEGAISLTVCGWHVRI